PAAGVGDREAADRLAGRAVQPHLHQTADAAGGTGGDPGQEVHGRGGPEVDAVEPDPVPIGDVADIRALQHDRALVGVERLGLDRGVRVPLAAAGRWRRGWRRGRPAVTVAVPDRHVVDQHRVAGLGGRGRGGEAGDPVREATADGHVQDDEVAGVAGHLRPRVRRQLALADAVVRLPVHIPAQLVRGDAGVPLERVGVEIARARAARTGPAVADAVELVAGSARGDSAVEYAPDLVEPVDVLHHVELATAGPVVE